MKKPKGHRKFLVLKVVNKYNNSLILRNNNFRNTNSSEGSHLEGVARWSARGHLLFVPLYRATPVTSYEELRFRVLFGKLRQRCLIRASEATTQQQALSSNVHTRIGILMQRLTSCCEYIKEFRNCGGCGGAYIEVMGLNQYVQLFSFIYYATGVRPKGKQIKRRPHDCTMLFYSFICRRKEGA